MSKRLLAYSDDAIADLETEDRFEVGRFVHTVRERKFQQALKALLDR